MPQETWDRIQEIFLEAVELPPAERRAFLEAACDGDTGVREEVESLLRAEGTGESAVETVIESEVASMLDEDSLVGTRLGPYRLVAEIGHGGMGSVYLAKRDDEQYHKQVAVKVVRRGMDTAQLLGRFRHERQILAELEHPYIARLIDGGTTPDGRPFLVMEHVEGQPIDTYCRENHLSLESRLRLFVRVCEAVSHAHRALVIHRDLKPSNILVTADGVPKLLDFGVAKLLSPAGDAGMTAASLAMGPLTPAYSSPEQVRGLPMTTATDVYALGAILFELLTEERAQKIDTYTPAEIERVVCHTEVPRPSSVARAPSPARQLKGDLDNIVLMAMRKERERRYASVDQLAEDVTRHLEGQPVRARQDSFGYRTQKFVARHRVVVVLPSVLSLVLLAGTALVSWQAHTIRAQRGSRLQSLVVLPLQNLSGDLNQDYFVEGMTDELTTQLAKIKSIRVISRTSAMRYKGARTPLSQIARELNVDGIVEGSVIRTGNTVRLTAQLIDPSTDQHLWAESYERRMQDIPSLQKEVARNIVGEIEAKLTPNEKMNLNGAAPISPEVYEAYLKGRYYLHQATEEGLTNSLAYFQQAVERDPNYALGYAGLADAYIGKVFIGTLPRMVLPKAKVAADKALQLDDTLAEAHAALAFVKAFNDHDWRGAEPEFRRAIELNPGNAVVHYYYAAGYLLPLGQLDEAIEEMKKAVWLDPLSPIVNVGMGFALFHAGKYDQAIMELHKALDLDPNLYEAHWVLMNIYEQKAMYPEAVVEFQRHAAAIGYKPGFVASIHQSYVTAGVSGYWQKRLYVLNDLAKHGLINFSEHGIVYLHLGEKERALRSLEMGAENRDVRSTYLNVDPELDGLRAEPRFQDLVRRLNLPPTDTQRAGR